MLDDSGLAVLADLHRHCGGSPAATRSRRRRESRLAPFEPGSRPGNDRAGSSDERGDRIRGRSGLVHSHADTKTQADPSIATVLPISGFASCSAASTRAMHASSMFPCSRSFFVNR